MMDGEPQLGTENAGGLILSWEGGRSRKVAQHVQRPGGREWDGVGSRVVRSARLGWRGHLEQTFWDQS